MEQERQLDERLREVSKLKERLNAIENPPSDGQIK
jgi:hypothetical protein